MSPQDHGWVGTSPLACHKYVHTTGWLMWRNVGQIFGVYHMISSDQSVEVPVIKAHKENSLLGHEAGGKTATETEEWRVDMTPALCPPWHHRIRPEVQIHVCINCNNNIKTKGARSHSGVKTTLERVIPAANWWVLQVSPTLKTCRTRLIVNYRCKWFLLAY